MGGKKFWRNSKPFLASKGFIHNENVSIEIKNKLFEEESELGKQPDLY